MSNSFLPINLYITSLNFDPNLISQNVWIYPDITTRFNYSCAFLGSLELFKNEDASLFVQLESGLVPFDASINGLERSDAFEPVDTTTDDFTSDNELQAVPDLQNVVPDASLVSVEAYAQDPYYDASGDKLEEDNFNPNRPKLDASFVNHTARNYRIKFELSLAPTTLSPTELNEADIFDTPAYLQHPYYQNYEDAVDNLYVTASVSLQFPFFNYNYFTFPTVNHFSSYSVHEQKLITSPILTVIGCDLDVTCDIDNNYQIGEPWNQAIDASSSHGVLDNNFYSETSYTKLFHKLEIQQLPYGYTEYSYYDGLLKLRGYLPSPRGGYLPARYLASDMLLTDPITVGIGFLGLQLFNSDLLPYVVKEFINFQSYCSANKLYPGWPDKINRLWTTTDNQRNLLNNAIFGIFFLEGLFNSGDNKLLDEASYYLDKFINWIADSIDLSVGLSIDGYDSRGFTIFNYNYSTSLAICMLLSKYLTVSFDFRIYDVATNIFNEALNYVNYLDEIEEKEGYDFYLYYYWFGNAFNISEIKDYSSSSLTFHSNSLSNINLVEYSLRINDVNFPEQPYTDVWDNDLRLVTLKTAYNENRWVLSSVFSPNRSNKIFYNIQRDKALLSMPVGENWYSEESLKPNGLVYELVSSLIRPLKDTYNSISVIKDINNLEGEGIVLDNLATLYGLKRHYFETDAHLKERLSNAKSFRGSRKEDIRQLLEYHFPDSLKQIRWNLITDVINYRFRFNDLWEFTPREVDDEYELAQQALLNQQVEGVPGLYVSGKDGFIFKPWDELLGIEITFSDYNLVEETGLSLCVPLGINLYYVFTESFVEEIK